MEPERTLYQFPISHFCEKTRWNLDAKGLSYALRDLPPGLHFRTTRRLAGGTTVPVLVDRGTAVCDSAAIAQHLDRVYPERPLLPSGEADRARAIELETYFGKHAGRAVRQWMYGQLLVNAGDVTAVLLESHGRGMRIAGRIMAPIIERLMTKRYRLHAEGVASARRTLDEVFERLEQETGGDPERYLVGGALSIADISAASLLAPLVCPTGCPWDTPVARAKETGAIRELRAGLSGRPAGAWVRARYAKDRRARPAGELRAS